MSPRSLEAARHLLRMIAFDAAAERKIRRAAEDEIKCSSARINSRVAEIADAGSRTAIDQTVIGRRFPAPDARSPPAPRWSRSARLATATRRSSRPTLCLIPGRALEPATAPMLSRTTPSAHRRWKTVTVAKLKDPEMAADGVERFVRRHLRRRMRARRNYARLRPPFEVRFDLFANV